MVELLCGYSQCERKLVGQLIVNHWQLLIQGVHESDTLSPRESFYYKPNPEHCQCRQSMRFRRMHSVAEKAYGRAWPPGRIGCSDDSQYHCRN